jgi:hypothetical protein
MKADAENWDSRNKAVLQITDIVRSYEGQPTSVITEMFSASVFRLLKEPVKTLISDLRSQQVRDVCTLLVVLAKVTGERMKPFLRDSFVHILEAVKVPNKVMSGYVDDCIQNMIRYCTFKSCIPLILMEIKDNKAKIVREKCLEYLNSILLFWDMSEKDIDAVCDALKIGLEDASPKARETARTVFHSLASSNLRRAERLKADLPRSVQSKLQIDDGGNALDTSTSSIHFEHSTQLPEAPRTVERVRAPAAQPMSSQKPHTSSLHSMSNVSKAEYSKSFSGSASTSSSLFTQPTCLSEPPSVPQTPSAAEFSSNAANSSSFSNVRASTSTMKLSSAAVGSRRRSVVKNPFADISDSFAQGYNLSNSLSSSQDFAATFPKMSPSKGSPASSTKSSHRHSPAFIFHQSDGYGSNSGHSSPAGIRGNSLQERSTMMADSTQEQFSAATTMESVSSESIPPNSEKFVHTQSLTKEIAIHSRVYAHISKDNRLAATVRFVGPTQFASGVWIGVELDTPAGKNNGSVQGVPYFWCRPNYGLFLREENVSLFSSISEGEKRILTLTKSLGSNEVPPPLPVPLDNASPSSTVMSSSALMLEKVISNVSDPSSKPSAAVSIEATEKRNFSAGILKLKLSTVMNFLNAQLELVEDLEKEERMSPESTKATQIRQEIKSITESELETIISFRNKWNNFV